MNDEELKDLSVEVKEWFQDQVELDCDCMKVESEVDKEDESKIVIKVDYHSKEWSVANPDGVMFETETSLDEYLKDKISADLNDTISQYDVEYSNVEVTVSSMFDFTVTIEGKYAPKEESDKTDLSDLF